MPVVIADDERHSKGITRLFGLGLMLAIVGTGSYAFNTWSSHAVGPGLGLLPERTPRGVPQRREAKSWPAQPTAGAAAFIPEQPEAVKAASTEPVLSAEEIERRRLRELETAEQDRRRSEQIEADIAARELKHARARVSITMYSTSWCSACKAARAYMLQEGISFVEHDIEKSESARLIMERLNPRGSVPTIDIDDTILVGFSGSEIEDTIDAAAKRRAGG